jgi:hypothetical protein
MTARKRIAENPVVSTIAMMLLNKQPFPANKNVVPKDGIH